MAGQRTAKYVPTAAGATVTLDTREGIDLIYIIPSAPITLNASYQIQDSGTNKSNTYITIIYGGTITSNTAIGRFVTIFGINLSDAQALYPARITCFYNGTGWDVHICMDQEAGNAGIDGANLIADSVPTAAITPKAITTTELADLTYGSILIGNATARPTALRLDGDAKILIGNGVTATSVAVTGDVTINNTVVTTIGAGKVTAAMLAYTPVEYLIAEATISTASVLTLFSVPIELIATPGAGKAIIVVNAIAYIDYNTAAYVGGGNIILSYSSDPTTSFAVVTSTILTSATDRLTPFGTFTTSTVAVNDGVTITNLTANATVGDSPIYIKILYYIADFN